MSKIGKISISIPEKVKVALTGQYDKHRGTHWEKIS
jgi:ribosomal protein L6P/L9E